MQKFLFIFVLLIQLAHARNCAVGFTKKELKYQVLADTQHTELRDLKDHLKSKGIDVEYIYLSEFDDYGVRIVHGGESKFNKALEKMDYFMEVPEIIFRLKEDSTAMGFYSPSSHYIYLSKGVVEKLDTTGQVTFFHELRHSMLNYRNYSATENVSYLGNLRQLPDSEDLIWVAVGDKKYIHQGYSKYMSIEESITWRKDLTKNMEYIRKAIEANDRATLLQFFERVEKKASGSFFISKVHEEVFGKVISDNMVAGANYNLIKRNVNGRERLEAVFKIDYELGAEKTSYNLSLPVLAGDPNNLDHALINSELNEQIANMYRLSVANRQLASRVNAITKEITDAGIQNQEKMQFWMNLFSTTSPSSYTNKNSTLAQNFMEINGLKTGKVSMFKESEAFAHLYKTVKENQPQRLLYEGRESHYFRSPDSKIGVYLELDGKFISFDQVK